MSQLIEFYPRPVVRLPLHHFVITVHLTTRFQVTLTARGKEAVWLSRTQLDYSANDGTMPPIEYLSTHRQLIENLKALRFCEDGSDEDPSSWQALMPFLSRFDHRCHLTTVYLELRTDAVQISNFLLACELPLKYVHSRSNLGVRVLNLACPQVSVHHVSSRVNARLHWHKLAVLSSAIEDSCRFGFDS